MKNDQGNSHKIINLEQIRKARGEEPNILAILKDTKRIAMAVAKRTCVQCNTMKMCVNKTGLCAVCYLNLTPKQKKVADEEARHKQVELKVTDDRWEKTEDH